MLLSGNWLTFMRRFARAGQHNFRNLCNLAATPGPKLGATQRKWLQSKRFGFGNLPGLFNRLSYQQTVLGKR